jgi:acyl-CoA thioesterase
VTPQDRAEKCAALMFSQDTASQGLDMVIEDVGTGHAKLSMSVGPNMLNGHGICHGGYIFTLADSAFAFACNTYNQLTVAQQNQITYIEAAKLGERLIATATETSRTGRSGTYDVVVTGENERTIALFHGLSRTIKGQHFPEPANENGVA